MKCRVLAFASLALAAAITQGGVDKGAVTAVMRKLPVQ
jgi:hypothetical protein